MLGSERTNKKRAMRMAQMFVRGEAALLSLQRCVMFFTLRYVTVVSKRIFPPAWSPRELLAPWPGRTRLSLSSPSDSLSL